ncbi:MAG: CdaR family protein [Flavobacteriaceae bacterium]
MVSEKTKQKNPKIKSFFFFLLLAILFWFLTKFSKDTQTTLTTGIEYINTPPEIVVTNANSKELSFEVFGNGFQLLSHKVKKATLQIDVLAYYTKGDTVIKIPLPELQKIISRQLNLTNSNIISENELTVFLDINATKKVPVRLASKISYKEGYFKQGKINISPDSIVVSGPSAELDTLTAITTQFFKKSEVSNSFMEKVPLVPFENKKIKFSPNAVEVSLQVQEFSQKKLFIPIEIVNVPKNVTLKLFPEVIEIGFDVAVSDFGKIGPNDFKVICDFSEKIEGESFLIPKIIQAPKGIQHIDLQTKKVAFLIFK